MYMSTCDYACSDAREVLAYLSSKQDFVGLRMCQYTTALANIALAFIPMHTRVREAVCMYMSTCDYASSYARETSAYLSRKQDFVGLRMRQYTTTLANTALAFISMHMRVREAVCM